MTAGDVVVLVFVLGFFLALIVQAGPGSFRCALGNHRWKRMGAIGGANGGINHQDMCQRRRCWSTRLGAYERPDLGVTIIFTHKNSRHYVSIEDHA